MSKTTSILNFNEILKKGGNWYKRTTSTIMLNGHYILRNLVSYIRLNVVVQISFLSTAFVLGNLSGQQFLSWWLWTACLLEHDKAQGPRLGDMEAQAQEVRRWLKSPSLLSFPNQAWFLLLWAVNFSVKPITQQFLHFFRIFFPAPVSEFQKILLFEYTRELLEKSQNQQQTQRSYIYIVTSGIRVQATLIGGDSCSPFLRSKSVIHAFSPL